MFDFSSDVEEEDKDHFSTEKLRLKASDTSVCEVNFNDDVFETPDDDSPNEQDLHFNLHRLIFEGNLERIEYLYDKRLLTTEILERPDHRGNKPVHLAAKLSKRHEKYLFIVQFLLNIGANFKAKDKEGWTIIDESVTHVNIRLMGIIFDYCCERK
jgi:ankyrin repeat protein